MHTHSLANISTLQETLSSVLAAKSVSMLATIDATRRGVIVVGGGTDSGAKRSTDGGRTWQPLNDGLAVPQAPSQLDFIQVLFARNGRLYGAAGFQGAMTLKTPTEPRRRAAHH